MQTTQSTHATLPADQFVTLADSRKLCYQIYGSAEGKPVYLWHGFPGSRLQAGLIQQHLLQPEFSQKVCLVAFDRPGFGRSDHDPARTIASTCRDFRQLADQLGHGRFAVLGISCGGAYALNCAAALPNRVHHVGLLAGMGPMDVPEIRRQQLKLLRLMFCLARWHPLAAAPLLSLDCVLFRHAPERATEMLSGLLSKPDQQLLATRPELRTAFMASLVEAYQSGLRGILREAHLIASPRPFSLAQVAAPVEIYQGDFDQHVPLAMGRHIANHVRDGHFHHIPDEGHLSIVDTAFVDCLQRLLITQ